MFILPCIEQFSIDSRTIHSEQRKRQWELKVKTSASPKARENAGDQVVIGVSFACDWLREWHEFSGPIKERSKAKPMQFPITFDTFKIFSYEG